MKKSPKWWRFTKHISEQIAWILLGLGLFTVCIYCVINYTLISLCVIVTIIIVVSIWSEYDKWSGLND